MPQDTSATTLEAVLARLAELEKQIEQQALTFEKTLAKQEAQFATQLAQKDQIIAALHRRLYGSKSARLDPAQEELDFTDDIMGKPDAPSEEDGASEQAESVQTEKPKRTRRAKRDQFPQNLAVIVKAVLIPDEVQQDPDAYREIGQETHDEINCTRSELYWERTVRKKFARKDDRTLPPVIQPAPEPTVPGTGCAAGFLAMILADKYLEPPPY